MMPIAAVLKKFEPKVTGSHFKVASQRTTLDVTTPVEAPLIQRKASCSCGGGCPRCQSNSRIQAKLNIGQPNHIYEQEADRVADQIMRMPDPLIQRKPG